MAARKNDRKLARRWAFLKRRLLRLPQEPHGFEVDFCPLPDIVEGECGFWLGLIVDHENGSILMTNIVDEPSSQENAAELLSRAMESSHPKVPCRPEMVFLRDNLTWEPLFPFLERLEIETVITDDLIPLPCAPDPIVQFMIVKAICAI